MTSHRVFFSIALLSAVTAGVAPAGAQQAQRAGQFRLQLSVIQNTISVAEPLRLLMEATAEGEPFTGAVLLAPLAGWGEVIIEGPAGEARHSLRDLVSLSPFVYLDALPSHILPLQQPGTSLRSELWLGYNRRRRQHVFTKPGQYQVHVEVTAFYGTEYETAKDERLRSSTASITVAECEDAVDAEAWQVPAQVVMFYGGENPLDTLLQGKPDSPYDHYARFALASCEATPLAERVTLLRQVTESPEMPPQLRDPALKLLRELAR